MNATDQQKAQIGREIQWILRQPNGRQLLSDKGGKCPHGDDICQDCYDEAKVEIARLHNEHCNPAQVN